MKSMTRNKIILLIAGLVFASFATGCAQQYKARNYSNFYWPRPPEKKRIQLLKMIRTDLDIRQPKLNEELFGGSAYFAFKKPADVVADNSGNVYISDTYSHTIFKLNIDTGKVMTFGPTRRWKEPKALAIDTKNGLLGIVDHKDTLIYSLAQGRPAFPLTGVKMDKPAGIAFDPERKLVYVSDIRKSEIYQFDYTGKHLNTFGGRGNAKGSFYFPGHMAVNPDGLLYVVDIMNWRIQVIDSDGNFIRSFGGHGSAPGQFGRPKGIAINRDGVVMVTDGDFNRATLYTSTGTPLLLFGNKGRHPGEFLNPYGAFIDRNDRFYVVDQTNRRVHVYQLYTDNYYEREFEKEVTSTPKPQ